MDTTHVVSLEDVWVQFNGSIILESIDLKVHSEEIVSIVGPNGAGKTTLLRVITGLVRPNKGKILVLGKSPLKIQKSGLIGYIPQKSNLDRRFPLNVYDVVAMARWARKSPFQRLDSDDKEIVRKALGQVGMDSTIDEHYGRLSEGQKQRVLIARALAGKPKLLIMDEPSTGLDMVAQDTFYKLLKCIRDEEKISIIMVSHDVGTVSGVVDRIACLNRKIHFHGEPKNGIPAEAVRRVFGQNVSFLVHDEHCNTCEKDQ